MPKRPLMRALAGLAKQAARGFIKGMAPHVARALEAHTRRPKIDSASERRADQAAEKKGGRP